jgi:hypothetical protein
LPELLGEPDKNPFGTADVAEPIRVFILDHLADDLRAALFETGERTVDVSFDWGAPLELEPKFGEELNGGIDVFYHDADGCTKTSG